MAMKATHELHTRRLSRNVGVALVLLGFAAVMFGLTVAKINGGATMQAFDHVVRPELTEAGR